MESWQYHGFDDGCFVQNVDGFINVEVPSWITPEKREEISARIEVQKQKILEMEMQRLGKDEVDLTQPQN